MAWKGSGQGAVVHIFQEMCTPVGDKMCSPAETEDSTGHRPLTHKVNGAKGQHFKSMFQKRSKLLAGRENLNLFLWKRIVWQGDILTF